MTSIRAYWDQIQRLGWGYVYQGYPAMLSVTLACYAARIAVWSTICWNEVHEETNPDRTKIGPGQRAWKAVKHFGRCWYVCSMGEGKGRGGLLVAYRLQSTFRTILPIPPDVSVLAQGPDISQLERVSLRRW